MTKKEGAGKKANSKRKFAKSISRQSTKQGMRLDKLIFFILVAVVIIFLLVRYTSKHTLDEYEPKKVRVPAYAGTWYPGEEAQLALTLTEYFENAKSIELNGSVKALIVPHASYIYSGQVAANGFNLIGDDYDTVFILATNHAQNAVFQGISLPDFTHYKTPLGEVKISPVAKKLVENELFTNNKQAHTTHVIELELPFLQSKFKNNDFEIVPMVTSALDVAQIQEAADLISKHLNEKSLVVVSTDLSHYHPYDKAVELDTKCIENIERMKFSNASRCEACGLYSILVLMEIASRNNWEPSIVDYKNSGDTAGSKDRVVGYSSIVFTEKNIDNENKIDKKEANADALSDAEKSTLLKLARDRLESVYFDRQVNLEDYNITSNLKRLQGCFSTLNKDHNLRGCIGHILPQEELYKCVMDNIENAALNDRRFQPVSKYELESIEIEISVLTVPEKLEFSSGEDLKKKLKPDADGVVLKKGWHHSTYLPQVWGQLPTHEMFLSSLCKKAGMTQDCWHDTKVEVYTYQAIVFHEE